MMTWRWSKKAGIVTDWDIPWELLAGHKEKWGGLICKRRRGDVVLD